MLILSNGCFWSDAAPLGMGAQHGKSLTEEEKGGGFDLFTVLKRLHIHGTGQREAS